MFSIKPKKVSNNDYLNISNNNNENNSVLSIDLKTINFENISVELALNILQLKHNEYYNMNQTEIIQYYNNKMKLTNNINNILALKIILKYKLKGLDIKINKMNGIMLSDNEQKDNLPKKSENTKNNHMEQKINSIINISQDDDYKIQQVQQNNFKIIQKNSTQNSNIIELPKNLYVSNSNSNDVKYPTININNNTNSNTKNIIMYKQPNQPNQSNQPNQLNQLNQSNQQNQPNQSNQPNQFIQQNQPNQSIQSNQQNQQNQFIQQNQPNQFIQPKQFIQPNNFNTSTSEKINNMVVITSSEFDIDTIINSYTQKKNYGLVR